MTGARDHGLRGVRLTRMQPTAYYVSFASRTEGHMRSARIDHMHVHVGLHLLSLEQEKTAIAHGDPRQTPVTPAM